MAWRWTIEKAATEVPCLGVVLARPWVGIHNLGMQASLPMVVAVVAAAYPAWPPSSAAAAQVSSYNPP